MAGTQSLGIFGGTFDPVHYGHLLAAQWAGEAFGLDEIIFIPAARPPHKDPAGVINGRHRLRMVELAIKNNPTFSVSALELERSGYSYTVDTIRHFLLADPRLDIRFILGVDALQLIHTWKEVEQLITLCRFIVVTRPGYELDRADPVFATVPAELWDRIDLLAIPGLEISSSEIRKRIAAGRSVRYLLPPEVAEYIKKNELYRNETNDQ
ncbi:MAG TPA: nicotinate-nucleotide adenylyltransferase [Syntrophomonas sp.]|nr:nicotinate-nucleotide adenylyltransferase [Syntrophomonas sp.]HRW12179.1 nicotinate-nucleotide adenylyltransferase [Syntrophomonas sp.]